VPVAAVRADLGTGVTALFTTRSGGVSPEPWGSLNLGANVGDDPLRVARNRQRVSTLVGAPLVFVSQVHADGVVHIGSDLPAPGGSRAEAATPPEADAIVTDLVGTALAVTVADCVPVLMADPDRRLVAAVHAGRAGILAGVVERAVDRLRRLGALELRAVVGPCVCEGCYEVPAAMREEVCARVPAAHGRTRQGTPSLDLRAAVGAHLEEAGVTRVEHVRRCTMEDDAFYSHRRATRAGTTTGRFAGVVVLDPSV